MAISIDWQAMPPHKKEETREMLLFPRMKENGTVSERMLFDRAAKRSVFSVGELNAALYEIVDAMSELLAEGKAIELPELGTFRLAIGTNAPITASTRRRKDKIEVRGVNFIASDDLMRRVGKPEFRWEGNETEQHIMSLEELKEGLRTYFSTHNSITRAAFQEEFHLKTSTAYLRLKALINEGALAVAGYNQETRYVKGNKL